jgi:Fur family ferric uptake transcriptional regulator
MLRQTRQRAAVERALGRAAAPVTAVELLQIARAEVPTLGIATVYRTMRQLLAIGRAVPVVLPGDAPRVEAANATHHHFFKCRGCDSVFTIVGCPGQLERLLPPDFALESHELVLYGRCATCTSATA